MSITPGKPPAIVRPEPKKGVPFSELSPEQKMAFGRPSVFGRKVLGFDLSEKQAEACDLFMANRARPSVVCSNEAGKTTRIIPTVSMWHLTLFPRRGDNGGVTATSGSWNQIKNQLMPALHALAPRFPRWDFQAFGIVRDGFPNFMAYSTKHAGTAEGFHGSPQTPLMMLFDECKSISDAVIKAGEDRCRPQRLGLLSSPGFSMGKFYASHSDEAAYWQRCKIDVDDCPWIDRVEMKRIITRTGGGDYERGLLDPFIQSTYFAKFMPFVQDSLVSLVDIEQCLSDPPTWTPSFTTGSNNVKIEGRHVRCDFARGGDENTIGVRHGNRVWLADSWRERDTHAACARFVTNFEHLKKTIGLQPQEVEGDADGIGGAMVDTLRTMGWPILEYHANAQPFDPTRFKNRESENWFNGCEAIEKKRVLIPDDAEMKVQMVDRQKRAAPDGRRWIESKKELFARQAKEKRPKRSPDRAEAILGALGELPMTDSVSLMSGGHEPGPWDNDPDMGEQFIEREGSIPEEVLRGFNAGG